MTNLIDALAARSGDRHPLLEAQSGCGGSCATPAAGPARRTLEAPPVRVGGVEIPEAEIAREMQHHGGASIEEARAAAAQALVVRLVLLQRATALGLPPTPEQDALGRWESDEEALIRVLLEREAPPNEPTQGECRRVFEARRAKFPMEFATAEPIIRDRLRARAWMAASAAYVARLVRETRIEGLSILPEGPP